MFRRIIGIACLVAGAIFLTLNSIILFRGAWKYGHDETDRLAFGIAAAVVPWVIAILPALIQETWRKSLLGLYRPSTGTMAVGIVWIVFIAYNLTTGAGVIATSRLETVADRDKSVTSSRQLSERRERLKQQLSGIPAHRPTEAVKKELQALKTVKAYENSKQCAEPTTRDQRENCQRVARTEAELASSIVAGDINAKIEELDREIDARPAVVSSADPQADLIRDMTGASREKIQLWLPAATPIVLELGAALMWHFGFGTLGIGLSHRESERRAPDPIAAAPFNPAPLISPAVARAPAASLEAITAQRKLAEWFFATCARPVAEGSLSEADWYDHYVSICRRSNDQAFSPEQFRRIAARFVPRIETIDGSIVYGGMLPVVPQET